MRRPDASMSLLTDLQEQALEPEYRSTEAPRGNPLRLLIGVALVVALITVAVVQTTRGSGTAATQRQELLDRVAAARARQADLGAQAASLDDEVRLLGERSLADPAQRERLAGLEIASGGAPVTGPGIVVTVSDAPGATNAKGLVLDGDLTRLVNGLWQAGAEAVAINGRRITTLTPIRSAGAAITVDYVSLSPPYRVEAIGDPATLQARFNETPAAVWWQFIHQNYGVTIDFAGADGDLTLPADPGMTLRYAKQE